MGSLLKPSLRHREVNRCLRHTRSVEPESGEADAGLHSSGQQDEARLSLSPKRTRSATLENEVKEQQDAGPAEAQAHEAAAG